jgi:hypothetical protein
MIGSLKEAKVKEMIGSLKVFFFSKRCYMAYTLIKQIQIRY